ncbi:hypothetical protein D3C72_2013780 [compost metagenome]
MTPQIDQRGAYDVLDQLAGCNSHIALAKNDRWGRGAWQLVVILGKAPPEADLAA